MILVDVAVTTLAIVGVFVVAACWQYGVSAVFLYLTTFKQRYVVEILHPEGSVSTQVFHLTTNEAANFLADLQSDYPGGIIRMWTGTRTKPRMHLTNESVPAPQITDHEAP